MYLDQVEELDASLAERNRASQHVEFYQEAVYMEAKSKLTGTGQKIYENRDYVRITQPGGRSTFVGEVKNDPATGAPSRYILEYPKQWTQYKAQLEQVGEGIPITDWAELSKAQVMMLKASHIHTVDQCAELNDGDLARLGMGFDQYRKKAQLYLESIKGSAPLDKLLAELTDERLRHMASEEMMKERIASLEELINRKNEDPKRGRPRKEESEGIEA